MMMASVGLNEEEISKLSMITGVQLQKVVNEVNGLSNFQMPTKEIKKEEKEN